MYCKYCGTKTEGDNRVCDKCQPSTNKSPRGSKIAIIFFVIIVLLLGLWGGYGIQKYRTIQAEKEAEQKKKERIATIDKTLKTLAGHGYIYGIADARTVDYAQGLDHMMGAFIEDYDGNYSTSGFDGTKKDYHFSMLERIFEDDDELTVTVLLFGYDYLEKEDVDYFAIDETVFSEDIKEEFKNALSDRGTGFNTYIITEHDRKICNNMSLKIRLAEEGDISVDEVYEELLAFVYEDGAMRTVENSLLENKVEYDEIAKDVEESFSGEKVYFRELTTSGKLVFLYLMPNFLYEYNEKGQQLWSDYYQETFDNIWDDMINDKIFEDIISD